ncbi:hypothetical protein [uncultured Gammaproteobacteria bacterium]|nr:hypothetical protein [uncultured Gammaproteobacteria bacterium]
MIADDKNNDSLSKNIEKEHQNLSELGIKLEMDVNAFEISTQANSINKKLLHYDRQLGSPKPYKDHQWNESETTILDAKMKLQVMKNKMSIQGNWGQIKLRMQDLKSKNPGRLKLKYQYGF